MQLAKDRKDVRKGRDHANCGKAVPKDVVNYQRGLIRNMCEETPALEGNSDRAIWLTNNHF